MAPTMDNTLGVLFDAVAIGSALYGAGCMQAWFYYRKYRRRDDWKLKTLVFSVLIFDSCQVAILAACVYNYAVTNHDDPTVMGTMFSTLIIDVIFSNLIGFLVQMFYIHRIWRLSYQKWYQYPMSVFVGSLSSASFGASTSPYYFPLCLKQAVPVAVIVYCAQALQWNTYVQLTQLKHLSITSNILTAVTDIAISASLIMLLRSSRIGVKRTDDMVARLMFFAFNTGLPTSVSALLACICINVAPDTFIYMFFFLMLGRFYTNSLLATLNSRDYVRRLGEPGNTCSFDEHVSSPVFHLSDSSPSNVFSSRDKQIAVQIDTVKESDTTSCEVEDSKSKAASLA